MEIIIFSKEYRTADSIAHFLDFYYGLRMKHLASDLLAKGLSPRQISEAVVRTIRVAKSSGIDTGQHFRPVFSGIDKEIISDCKLSHLAYGMVLLNADAELSVVGKWQQKVLEKYLESQSFQIISRWFKLIRKSEKQRLSPSYPGGCKNPKV